MINDVAKRNNRLDKIVICKLTDQRVNVSQKGSMAKCIRCYMSRCEAKSYPLRVY